MKKLSKKTLLSLGITVTMILGAISPATTVSASKASSQKDYKSFFDRLKLHSDQKMKASSIKQEAGRFSEDMLIVKYKTPLSNAVHHQTGTKLIKRVSSLGYDIVQVYNKSKLQDVLQAYAVLPGVSSVSRSAFYQQLGSPDLKTDNMYHLNTLRIDQANQLAGGKPVRVAILDTGIDAGHPELKSKMISNYNVLNPLKKGAPDVHGTHVAGIIAAEKNNGLGGFGVNPKVNIISIDVFNRSYFTNDFTIAEGILEAIRQKAQVINMSLSSWYPSPIVADAVKKALAANITIVAAAGNSGMNNMEYPAAFEGVISVGATNSKNQLADFSTFGPSIDIVAPGEGIYSTVYDPDKQSSFATLDGTSMAAPMVTGAVSLLLSKYPSLKPYQINYILNQTARDLGADGYDMKYGHGLLDPVAALQYPIEKISADPAISQRNVLQTAKPLEILATIDQSGAMTRLNQIDWYKFNVKNGEDIQTTLVASENYNYQFEYIFYPEDKTLDPTKITVNDVPENKVEGNLFHAPGNGVLAIGVKDANGNYNENHLSKYDLQIERYTEKVDDENTEENAIFINELPFNYGQMYFTNELDGSEEQAEDEPKPMPGDSDFFHYISPETESGTPDIVQIKLSDVPGIDSSINLFILEKFEDAGEQTYLIDNVNLNGFGDGEVLSFEAIPGTEYVIEVTNKPFFDPFYYYMFEEELDLDKSYSSNISYNLTLESKPLPADEDGFPMMVSPEETATEALSKGDFASYYEKKEELKSVFMEPYIYWGDQEYVDLLKENSLLHQVGQTEQGYFQYMGDEDLFQFTPVESAIYQFHFEKNEENEIPWLEIMTFDEQTKSLAFVGSNWMYNYDGQLNQDFHIGLKANQTYYLKVANELYRSSFKGYSFTSKTLVKNTGDMFEDNDTYETATNIGFKKITGNFSTARDMDMYYFKPETTDIYGFLVQPLEIPSQYAHLPKELLAPLDPIVTVIEDANQNKVLDKEEEGSFILTDYHYLDAAERGAFLGKKGAGYFIVVYTYLNEATTLTPYEFVLANTNQVDEDNGAFLKENVPSNPISFRLVSKTTATQIAYLNRTKNKGDADYFGFAAPTTSAYQINVAVPMDLDAVVTVYDANGNQMAKVDQYGSGDYEAFSINLKKGSYFIKIEDAFGNASISPYKVTLQSVGHH